MNFCQSYGFIPGVIDKHYFYYNGPKNKDEIIDYRDGLFIVVDNCLKNYDGTESVLLRNLKTGEFINVSNEILERDNTFINTGNYHNPVFIINTWSGTSYYIINIHHPIINEPIQFASIKHEIPLLKLLLTKSEEISFLDGDGEKYKFWFVYNSETDYLIQKEELNKRHFYSEPLFEVNS